MPTVRAVLALFFIAAAGVTSHPSSSRAAGVVSTCNEAAFDSAMAGNGTVTFACSGTITFTSTKTVRAGEHVSINGAGFEVTMSGGGAVRLFSVDAGGSLQLQSVTLMSGAPASDNFVRVGGAISNAGSLTVTDSRFQNNMAAAGGAVHNQGSLTVQRSAFLDNAATGHDAGGGVSVAGDGGAIANLDVMDVRDSSFFGNTATYGGGGLANWGIVTVTGSTFGENSSAGRGGAITNYPFGSLRVVNSTFTENSATFGAAAVENHGTAVAINTTLSGNQSVAIRNVAGDGFAGHFTLANTIVVGSPIACVPGSEMVDAGGNVVEAGSCGFALQPDPGLGPLQDNGGPTWTMAISRGSPAFGVGVSSTCAAPAPVGAGGADQRGTPRVTCSSGAFEPASLPVRAFVVGLSRDGP